MKFVTFAFVLFIVGVVEIYSQTPPRIGAPAPEITGKDVFGKPLKLSQFRGKVVLLDFWGDW